MRITAEPTTTISLSPPSPPRLSVRPPDPPRTLIARTPLDGGWWPRSADPTRELPGLILAIDAIDDRHSPITRVMLGTADWDSHPRSLRIESPAPGDTRPSRIVRLGWFDTMPAGLLTATCTDGRRTDLLTVPPKTNPATARAAIELAAHPDNVLHTPDILSAINTPAAQEDEPAADTGAENTWESEGGRLNDTNDTNDT
jgi:uncharacterized protein DUF5994